MTKKFLFIRQLGMYHSWILICNLYSSQWYVSSGKGCEIIKDEVIFVSDLGGKKYLFVQMFQDHFLCSSIFKIFHTWSSYFDFKINFYNTLCWYSGKDTGLSPERPQFKSLHYQAFLQKAFPWKFFKKWLSPRRIMIWPLKRGEIIHNPPLIWYILSQWFQNHFWKSSYSPWVISCNKCAFPHVDRVFPL